MVPVASNAVAHMHVVAVMITAVRSMTAAVAVALIDMPVYSKISLDYVHTMVTRDVICSHTFCSQ